MLQRPSEKTHPVVRVDRRRTGAHVAWHVVRVAGEEPNVDEIIRALHRVPAAAVCVERRAVAVRRRSLHTTPGISVRIHVAVVVRRSAGHSAASGHRAVRARVEGHCVRRLVVDAFDPGRNLGVNYMSSRLSARALTVGKAIGEEIR